MRGLVVSASYFERAFVNKRPNLSKGGIHFPYTEDGLYPFNRPSPCPACKAVTLGDASDGCLWGPEEIVMKLRVNSRHASAQQLTRVLLDSDVGNLHLLTCVDEVLEQCGLTCLPERAFDKAPHTPIAGPPPRPCEMKSYRQICFFWATPLPRMR